MAMRHFSLKPQVVFTATAIVGIVVLATTSGSSFAQSSGSQSSSKSPSSESKSKSDGKSDDESEVKTLTGIAFKIIDGDSIVVRDSEKNEQMIHLEGIDAPEAKQTFGEQASRALEELVKGKSVEIKWKKKDDFQRILGQVYIEDKHVNRQLIDLGLAWHFVRYFPSEEFAEAQSKAKQSKKGLWSESDPIAPWDFRRKNREKQ